MSITSILIPQQRLLPQGHKLPQRVHNGCKLQCFVDQRRSHGLYAQRNDGNYHHRQHGNHKQQQQAQATTTTTTAAMTCAPHVMRVTIAGQAVN